MTTPPTDQLQKFRQQIDSIDSQIIELIGKRMKIAQEITPLKMTITDPKREEELIKIWEEKAMKEGISKQCAEQCLQSILIESKRRQMQTNKKMNEDGLFDFDQWNMCKKKTEQYDRRYFFNREIWFARIGKNIGNEEHGKGTYFERPVLIFQKFSKELFWGIPLSTTQKKGKYYFSLGTIHKKNSTALLSHLRLFDAKRLSNRIGKIPSKQWHDIKKAVASLLCFYS